MPGAGPALNVRTLSVVGNASGDADNDSSVTLADHSFYTGCMHGPAQCGSAFTCRAFDDDADQDVDLADAAAFQRNFQAP
jgi:hypothetical protein